MVSLQQLSDEVGQDNLIDILEGFGYQAKDEYSDDDSELVKIREFCAYMKSIGSKSVTKSMGSFLGQTEEPKTTKQGKGKTSGAIAKTQAKQTKGKGAMVSGSQQAAIATVTQSKKQATQIARAANQEFVATILQERAAGLAEFANSMTEADETIAAITDEAIASLSDLEDEEQDFLLTGSGSFSLL